MKNTILLIKEFKKKHVCVSDLPLMLYIDLIYSYIKENENLIPIRLELDLTIGSLKGAIENNDHEIAAFYELTIRNITREILGKLNDLWKQ